MQSRVRHRAQSFISSDRKAASAALQAEFERQQNRALHLVDEAAILKETARAERKTVERGLALCARIRKSLSRYEMQN